MCDLIRRQDAIDAHYEYCNKHPDAGFPVWSLKILENLPSAQPKKRTEKRTETHACDCISRQAAIEAIVAQTIGYTVDEIKAECEENIFNENGYLGGLKDAIEAIEDMPPEQPEVLACGEGELIAQPEIIHCGVEPRCETCEAFNKTRLLIPQPERKKGHWIRHPEQRNIFNGKTIECSECHEKYTVQYVEDELFCRHCGADMREPEDIPMEYFESGGR